MSLSSVGSSDSLNIYLTVEDPDTERGTYEISEGLSVESIDYEEDSLTETCSSLSLSTISEDSRKSPIHFKNDDSDYSDYDTDNSFQEFNLKDWLKLAKTLVSKQETSENKSKLLSKYDELQDFFYFFAVEYFTGDEDVTELVSSKRKEFVSMWQDVIGPCDLIFDLLVDSMKDINVENSFRL